MQPPTLDKNAERSASRTVTIIWPDRGPYGLCTTVQPKSTHGTCVLDLPRRVVDGVHVNLGVHNHKAHSHHWLLAQRPCTWWVSSEEHGERREPLDDASEKPLSMVPSKSTNTALRATKSGSSVRPFLQTECV